MSTRYQGYRGYRRQRGITLIELVITIVVLSIALTAITLTLSEGISRSSDTLLELRAVALAQAYLDEVVGKRFDENSANTGVPPCRAPGTAGVPLDGICTAPGAPNQISIPGSPQGAKCHVWTGHAGGHQVHFFEILKNCTKKSSTEVEFGQILLQKSRFSNFSFANFYVF